MARRRYQQGQLIDDKDRWCARWREDVILPSGSPMRKGDKLLKTGEVLRRTRKWDVIATKRECPTKRLAQRKLEEFMRRINREDYTPASTETFSAFADRWKANVMIHHKESTQLEERRLIERVLKPEFGQYLLREINAEAVQRWVSGLKFAPKTVVNRASTFKLMWKTAKTWGYVQHDPFEGLRLPTLEDSNVYQFSAEEMMAIINEAKGWYKIFFELLAKTGMRPGEAAGLRPEDLDWRVITVKQSVWRGKTQTTKTKNSVRTFVISDQLADKLRQHIAENKNERGLIFVNKIGRPINGDHFVDKVLNPILKRLGIWAKIKALGLRCGNYAFRHGNMTELSRSGVPLKTIQARVGHAPGSKVTHKHYIHAVSADDVAAAEIMEGLLRPKQEEESVQ